MKSHRPGVDVAGQAAAVGGAVTQFKLGDGVSATPWIIGGRVCLCVGKVSGYLVVMKF